MSKKKQQKQPATKQPATEHKIFSGPFRGCVGTDVYPSDFVAGDIVPDELEGAASATGAVCEDEKQASELYAARQKEIAASDDDSQGADDSEKSDE